MAFLALHDADNRCHLLDAHSTLLSDCWMNEMQHNAHTVMIHPIFIYSSKSSQWIKLHKSCKKRKRPKTAKTYPPAMAKRNRHCKLRHGIFVSDFHCKCTLHTLFRKFVVIMNIFWNSHVCKQCVLCWQKKHNAMPKYGCSQIVSTADAWSDSICKVFQNCMPAQIHERSSSTLTEFRIRQFIPPYITKSWIQFVAMTL